MGKTLSSQRGRNGLNKIKNRKEQPYGDEFRKARVLNSLNADFTCDRILEQPRFRQDRLHSYDLGVCNTTLPDKAEWALVQRESVNGKDGITSTAMTSTKRLSCLRSNLKKNARPFSLSLTRTQIQVITVFKRTPIAKNEVLVFRIR